MKIRDRLRSVSVLLAVWYALVLLVTLVTFGGVTYFYLSDQLLATLDDSIESELEWTSNIVAHEFRTSIPPPPADSLADRLRDVLDLHFALNPRNFIVLVTTQDSVTVYESYNRQRALLGPDEIGPNIPHFVTLPDKQEGNIRVAAIRTPDYTIQVAYPFRWIRITLDHTSGVFFLLIPVAVLFSFSGGVIMASAVLRPFRNISRAAQRISAERLNERIPPRDVDDELGVLIRTINDMIGRLEQSFDDMKNLSAEIAHELKTPLSILKGETELALANPPTGKDLESLLVSSLEEIVRLSRIVDDLLTVSKADAGQLSISREPVDMQPLLADIAEDASLLADARGIEVHLESNEACTIPGDELRIRQALRNLVANAVQYSPAGSAVRIASNISEGSVKVRVTDQGMGIRPEDIGRIFERLYRSGDARAANRTGSGLGLSIVQRIVHLHGGTVTVESIPGEGSTFTVTLPLR